MVQALNNLKYYFHISVCFSGEVLCPGTQSTCKPRHYFCDGETDCPGNVDELNCCMWFSYLNIIVVSLYFFNSFPNVKILHTGSNLKHLQLTMGIFLSLLRTCSRSMEYFGTVCCVLQNMFCLF